MKSETMEEDKKEVVPAEGGGRGGEGQKVPLYKLFSFADGRDCLLMVIGSLAAIVNGLSLPLMTLIFGQLINAFGDTSISNEVVVHEVSKVVLKFVYLAVGTAIAAFLQVSCWMVTGERQSARIRSLYLSTILRQDIAFFDKEISTGEVVGRMSGDTILIQEAMGEKVGKFINLVSTFIGGFAIAFIKGWRLALVLMSCIPPLVVAGAAIALIMSKLASRGQIAYEEAGNVVEQTIGSIRTVVSFNGEKKATESYKKALTTAYRSGSREGFTSGMGIGVVLLILFSSYGLSIWYGSKLIITKNYNGGQVINVIMAIMMGGMSLGQSTPSVNALSAGQAAAYKMFQTIIRKPEIDAYDPSGLELEDIKGDIELRNVSFSYPTRLEIKVFDGFSLSIPSGTTTALVGESGSGKSTVISLVERFYDPQSGEVLIDGINVKDLRLGWIRQQIGLVSQEPVLFATTIKENIMYGKENATLEEIRNATELANAAKFIDKMPDGLDTMVGEHGTQLSGGQKQRIAIARAILKNPGILLLDEATSALDAESEHIVQEALLRIMVNRTTIVVAHRLSTVRNADSIAVVYRGKIVEQGSHDELTKDPEGAYSQLTRLQKGEDQVEETTFMEYGKTGSSLDSGRLKHSVGRSISRGSSTDKSVSERHSLRNSFSKSDVSLSGNQNLKKKSERTEERKPVPMRRLAYLNKPEIPVLLLGSVAAGIHGVTFPIFALLFSSAIKIFFEPHHELKKDSRFWALMFVLLGVVTLVTLPAQRYLFAVAGGKLIRRIRSLSFQKVIHQEISWFDEPSNSSGTIGARLSGDAASVKNLVGDTLALIVQNTSTVVAGMVIAMTANWKLALIVLVLIPLVGLQGYAQIKFLKGFSQDAKIMYEEASQVANDAVSSIRTVASFCAEKKVMDVYEGKCKGPKMQGVRQGMVSGAGFGFSFLVFFLTHALIFYIGARFVQDGKATFAEVFQVFFALVNAATGVSQTSALGPDTTKAKDAAASIFAILDKQSLIDSSSDAGKTVDHVEGNVEFKHVTFKYPTRPEVQIFRDLSLKIKSGKTVALVGESGSGKSTVISLLQRFYDPDSGEILLDGVEIKTLNLKWLRQQMGLVSQEPVLFHDTIRANIAYAKQGEVSEEEMIEASKAANAHAFISSLPNGYDTSVGERGVQMSGGQKQRIAIARAVLKNPLILLLDEATSALDAESERVVQEALDRVMVSRTTVVVAHRLSTIKGADVIAVVKNGEIAEQGTHEVLLEVKGGAYASLVALHATSS